LAVTSQALLGAPEAQTASGLVPGAALNGISRFLGIPFAAPVRDARTGDPFVEMRFYGEFRWHKRSEGYHILDVTHPDAAAYIAKVFRIWRREWGARYFKTDFMHFGSGHGPDKGAWH
jgi:hypothetical protein